MDNTDDLIDQILASNDDYKVEYDKSATDAILNSITDTNIDTEINNLISEPAKTTIEKKDNPPPPSSSENTETQKDTKNEETINKDLEKVKEEQKKEKN